MAVEGQAKTTHPMKQEAVTYLSRALDSLHDSLFGNNNNDDAKKDSTDSQRKERKRHLVEGVLIDTLWWMGILLEPKLPSDNPTAYTALSALLHELYYNTHTLSSPHTSQRLLSSLEPKLVASAGLVAQSNPQILLKKMRKLNTDLFYRQKKVNLLQ